MRITFTLTSGSLSTDAGPFNISGTTNSDVTYWIATGVTKTQLTNGHPVDTIYETITGGTIASTGTCTTTDTWSVTPAPTPTPTSTPSYSYQLGASHTNATLACSGINGGEGEPQDFLTEVFAATDQPGDVVRFFTDSGLTSGYGGESEIHGYYKTGGLQDYTGRVSPSGFVTDKTVCP